MPRETLDLSNTRCYYFIYHYFSLQDGTICVWSTSDGKLRQRLDLTPSESLEVETSNKHSCSRQQNENTTRNDNTEHKTEENSKKGSCGQKDDASRNDDTEQNEDDATESEIEERVVSGLAVNATGRLVAAIKFNFVYVLKLDSEERFLVLATIPMQSVPTTLVWLKEMELAVVTPKTVFIFCRLI